MSRRSGHRCRWCRSQATTSPYPQPSESSSRPRRRQPSPCSRQRRSRRNPCQRRHGPCVIQPRPNSSALHRRSRRTVNVVLDVRADRDVEGDQCSGRRCLWCTTAALPSPCPRPTERQTVARIGESHRGIRDIKSVLPLFERACDGDHITDAGVVGRIAALLGVVRAIDLHVVLDVRESRECSRFPATSGPASCTARR